MKICCCVIALFAFIATIHAGEGAQMQLDTALSRRLDSMSRQLEKRKEELDSIVKNLDRQMDSLTGNEKVTFDTMGVLRLLSEREKAEDKFHNMRWYRFVAGGAVIIIAAAGWWWRKHRQRTKTDDALFR